MSSVELVEVTSADDGMRLDRWFKHHYPTITHGQLQKMLRKKQVKLDGVKATGKDKVEAGQIIRVPPHDFEPSDQASRPMAKSKV